MRLKTSMVLLAAVSVAVLIACSQSNTPTLPDADFYVPEGNPFLIGFGDTAGVSTPSTIVLIQLSDVLSDSRCPESVECIDAGAVTIRLAVQTALSVQDVDIDVPPGANIDVVVEEITIKIITVNPAAMEGVTIDLLDYEVGMSVRQTGDPNNP